MDTLGWKIRVLRKARHLTQQQLGNGRLSASLVSQIEGHKTFPTPATLAILAERLGVDAEYFDEYARVNEQLHQYRRAKSLFESGNYRDAFAIYEDLISGENKDLKLLSLFSEAAECQYRLGRLDDATALYNRTVVAALEQNNAALAIHTYYRLGNIQRKRNLFSLARMYWMRAHAVLRQHPEMSMPVAVKVHTNLGRVNYLLGSYESAKRYYSMGYREAATLIAHFDQAVIVQGWANVLIENAEYSVAREMTERALSLYQSERHQRGINQCRLNLAVILRREGKTKEAMDMLTSFLRDPQFYRDPIRHAQALSERALCSLALGNPEEAWKDAELFMYMADSDKETWLTLQATVAEVCVHLRKYGEALDIVRQTLDSLPMAPYPIKLKLKQLYSLALAGSQRLEDALEVAIM